MRPPPSRIRIPIHIFLFGLGAAPTLVYLLYYSWNSQTEEELEEILKQKYSVQIKENQKQMQGFVKVLNGIHNKSPETEQRDWAMLRGGARAWQRTHAVDERLYGTEEGVAEKKRVLEEMRQQKEKKMREKKMKRKGLVVEKEKQEPVEVVPQTQPLPSNEILPLPSNESVNIPTVVTIAAVGTIAAVAGFLAGSRPR